MLPWRRSIGHYYYYSYYCRWIQQLPGLLIYINRLDSWVCTVFSISHKKKSPVRPPASAARMASLVHQASMPAMAPPPPPCDDELVPQGFSCFGRSLSRAASSSRLEYRALQGEEKRAAQDARSARAKLRWKAVAHELMAKGGGGGGGARRRKQQQQQLGAFSYDSRSYALNFDQGADE